MLIYKLLIKVYPHKIYARKAVQFHTKNTKIFVGFVLVLNICSLSLYQQNKL